MLRVLFISIAMLASACDQFFPPEVEGPPPLKIERVIKCNKYKTCVVVFSNGTQGLMTSPKAGEYGCKSISEYSYIRCEGR
ncbi:MAG TPA: hypothetical protein VE954_23685 [Oligoflexus sp.]|uniref:hypothetical protein n=1 Tax=Oligoflexus sp. TaxID=1971216 RepID=UPI002D3B8669|nr:hypothetical protein [Oligoflexus sp.]HYX36114.1 hypothetical protein [Oligoflexus sp.]